MGQAAMTDPQIAAERYGELSAYLADARSRREAERQYGLATARLGLLSRGQRAEEQGYKSAGLATILGTGAKLYETLGPSLKSVGQKAITGIRDLVTPRTLTSQYPTDYEAPINYGEMDFGVPPYTGYEPSSMDYGYADFPVTGEASSWFAESAPEYAGGK